MEEKIEEEHDTEILKRTPPNSTVTHQVEKVKSPSVQSVLEGSIKRMTGIETLVEGAGRTDSGVHALGQVAHFDLPMFIHPHKLMPGINFYCRGLGVVVLEIDQVTEDFHARFSAKSREYIYKVINRRAPLALEARRAWHVARPLNMRAMEAAALEFLGQHNFNAFRASSCQSKSSIKTLDNLNIVKGILTEDFFLPSPFPQSSLIPQYYNEINFHVKARSFLHNQVRIMVGTLIVVGMGKIRGEDIRRIIEEGNRKNSGPTAPAFGLYLVRVGY
jgi:tRNA pseudouridine38-40 synthase